LITGVERKGVTINTTIVTTKHCLAVWNCSLLARMEWCESFWFLSCVKVKREERMFLSFLSFCNMIYLFFFVKTKWGTVLSLVFPVSRQCWGLVGCVGHCWHATFASYWVLTHGTAYSGPHLSFTVYKSWAQGDDKPRVGPVWYLVSRRILTSHSRKMRMWVISHGINHHKLPW